MTGNATVTERFDLDHLLLHNGIWAEDLYYRKVEPRWTLS
jgi:hypothetical protein